MRRGIIGRRGTPEKIRITEEVSGQRVFESTSEESRDVLPKGRIFRGSNVPHDGIDTLPDPPPWRAFTPTARKRRGQEYRASEREIELVNAALYLRRPLLITGKPELSRSSLPYAVANELGLGEVLVWSITSRTNLQQGLYSYDVMGRLQDAFRRRGQFNTALSEEAKHAETMADEEMERYIQLGSMFGVMEHVEETSIRHAELDTALSRKSKSASVFPSKEMGRYMQLGRSYDFIGHLQEASRQNLQFDALLSGKNKITTAIANDEIGRYLRLGPLGTAMLGWPLSR